MWKRDCQRVRKMVISLVIVCSILCGKNVTRMILRQLMKPMLSSDLLICTIADHVLRDTNIGLKYRFNITSLPAIMMIRNGRYSFYNGSKDNYNLSCLLTGGECKTKELTIPGWKSNFEVFASYTLDNIMEIATIADIFGFADVSPVLKTLVSLVVLFLPIIIGFSYLVAVSVKKEKAKID
eukprot:TRINITY_DN22774_c0_g1_i1.p1 TRINITY_DN22774_c0_g1~~TRINITY_DN22774_c0_g1_i1.p1  ORF type:complete len:181 (+),score=37.94 TRINITY_DN22774_c0_g1_i1:285-827(+)